MEKNDMQEGAGYVGRANTGQPSVGDREVKLYAIGDRQRDDINNRYAYHAPRPDQIPRYNAIREKAKELAFLIAESTPPSREQSTAFTKLDEAMMAANASIARNEV